MSKIVTKFEEEIESIEKIKKRKEKSISKFKDENIHKQKEIEKLNTKLLKQQTIINNSKIEKQVSKWQLNSRLLLLITTIIFFLPAGYVILYMPEILGNSYIKVIGILLSAIWFFISKAVYDRHWNESNISNYKVRIST